MVKTKAEDMRILIIDDDADYSDLLSALLKKSSFQVTVCSYGEMGLAEAKRNGPDLIVLDVMMPGIHGLHALEMLRKDERTAQIPVIIISNMDRDEVEASAAEAGAGFVPKSAPIPEIVARIKQRLSVL